ncbi:hypothetical protein NP493_3435g00004 [Ridgeia piscesae]|uniref:Uncharacterized protein n=1 Tax=Ridgeia piscesae TaxID=27915 RepID=A0AAD9J878_RIDPI|nr:hypothetical protein NP493_3435g00004 [Ridgeia piscesae]
MNALKWTLALLVLCVALAPLIDASTEDEEGQIIPDVTLIPNLPSDIVIIPDVRSADVLIPDVRLAPGTARRSMIASYGQQSRQMIAILVTATSTMFLYLTCSGNATITCDVTQRRDDRAVTATPRCSV